ncbi:MAG: hypothetical protein FIA95_01910 [Gemmatimonadetes bacterium]|nr:hypothetical protein [Gemmatimonadota bacterium]
MRKGTLVAAVAAALLGVGATSAMAEPPVRGPANNTVDLRVVNNHPSPVTVYVQDAKGRPHYLGRIGSSDFKVLEIPGAIAAMGDVAIEVFPSEPAWSLLGESAGVKTNKIPLRIGDAVNIFIETSLLSTQVEIEKG